MKKVFSFCSEAGMPRCIEAKSVMLSCNEQSSRHCGLDTGSYSRSAQELKRSRNVVRDDEVIPTTPALPLKDGGSCLTSSPKAAKLLLTYLPTNLLTFKKAAFTLAEVLITLAIIGVVAALTIPTLVQNYQRKIHLVRFQKTYAALANGIKNYAVSKGCDSFQCLGMTGIIPKTELEAMVTDFYKNTFKIVKYCKDNDESCSGGITRKMFTKYCLNDECGDDLSTGSVYNEFTCNGCESIVTADGALIRFWDQNSIYSGDRRKLVYIHVLMDTNGNNGPNKMGYDVFSLFIYPDGKLIPEGSVEKDPNDNWKTNPYYCGKSNTKISSNKNFGNYDESSEEDNQKFYEDLMNALESGDFSDGSGCAARIIDEGWKITYF